MAITLGTIILELQAKTDAFTKGLSDAKSYTFSSVDGITSSLGKIGTALSKLKFENSAQITSSLKLLGGVTAGVAVAAGAALAVMTEKGIDAAAKMDLLAQSAGVPVETLSALGFAAKQNGIDLQALAGAMEKFSNISLKAAQSGNNNNTAFRQLGINVLDAQGKLRPTNDLILQIADKFSRMEDGALKTGLAIQLFGKAGAGMIPLLNQGRDGIATLEDQAKALGLVIDADTAAAAHKFEQSMNLLKSAGEGAALKLATALLPVLQQVVDNVTSGAEQGQSRFQDFLNALTVGVKAFVVAFGAVQTFFDDLGNFIKHFGAQTLLVFDGLGGAAAALWARDWAGLKRITSDTLGAIHQETAERNAESKTTWKEYFDAVGEMWNAKLPKAAGIKAPGPPPAVTPMARADIAGGIIAKLKDQTEAEVALAEAQLQGEQAVRAVIAASAAQKVLTELATAEAHKNKTTVDTERAGVEEKYGAYVRGQAVIGETAKVQSGFNKTLTDGARDQNIAADAHDRLAEAAGKGAAAIREVTIQNAILAISTKYGATLTEAEKTANDDLADSMRRVQGAEISQKLAEQSVATQNAAESTRLLIGALTKNDEAQIQAQARIEANNFATANNIELTDKRIAQEQQEYAARIRLNQVQQTASQLIADYDPGHAYQQTLDRINAAVKAGVLTDQQAIAVLAAKRAAMEQYVAAAAKTAGLADAGPMAGIRTGLAQATVGYGTMTQTIQNATKSAMTGIGASFKTCFTDIFNGTKTVGQAFADMGRSMLSSVVDALGQIVEQWIMTHIILAALNKIFGADMGGDQQAMAAADSNAAQATSAAFLGAANAYAFNAWDPPGAAIAAALALGVGLAFAGGALAAGSLKSGAGGFDVPSDMIMQVHKEEVVLPASLSRGFKSIMSNATPGSSSGGRNGNFSPVYSPVYNAPNASAPELDRMQRGNFDRWARSEMRKRGLKI